MSELTLGGLLKHLDTCSAAGSTSSRAPLPPRSAGRTSIPDGNRMTDAETVPGCWRPSTRRAARVDRTVREEADLDREVALPAYPWSPPEPVVWTVRRVLWHVFREIAHHSGHADIIREALDGASTTAKMAEAASEGR